MQCIVKGGRCVWVGNAEPTIQLDMKAVVANELEIIGTYAYTNTAFGEALEFLSSHSVDLDALISRTVPLRDGGIAFEDLAAGKDDLIKIVLTIGDD